MARKRVLVAPLDWGLGHATRCIPIITTLLENDFEVLLAGSGFSLSLLRREFPQLQAFDLPAYNPQYSKSGSMVLAMATQILKFVRVINQEQEVVERLVKTHNIDCIISDNRYGCRSEKAISIFVSHQLTIHLKNTVLKSIVKKFNVRQLKKFDRCWVPDYEGSRNLTGILSINKKIPNAKYIGTLSRFRIERGLPKKCDLLILLSGPEPQRSIIERILMTQLESSSYKTLVIRGIDGSSEVSSSGQIEIRNHLTGDELQRAILQSEIVIARSGYSTIMDLAKLEKTAIFIPTPGQTEQEYLAKRLDDMGIAYYKNQHEFNLNSALEQAKKYTGFKANDDDTNALQKAIEEIR